VVIWSFVGAVDHNYFCMLVDWIRYGLDCFVRGLDEALRSLVWLGLEVLEKWRLVGAAVCQISSRCADVVLILELVWCGLAILGWWWFVEANMCQLVCCRSLLCFLLALVWAGLGVLEMWRLVGADVCQSCIRVVVGWICLRLEHFWRAVVGSVIC